MKKYLLLFLLLITSCTTTNNYYNYYYQETPTKNISVEPNTNKNVVILGRSFIPIGEIQNKITTKEINSTNNINVVVPEFAEITVEGMVSFNIVDLTEIESSENLIINVKYNKIKNFEYIVLRTYTYNLDNKNGLIGNWNSDTVTINAKNNNLITEYESIPNIVDNAGLFDYMELDSWGAGCNNALEKAIKITDMPIYFMADFSGAINQTYSTILIIELAGVLL